MKSKLENYFIKELGFDPRILEISDSVLRQAKKNFATIDLIREYNQLKVINAMRDNNLSDTHFNGTTGYGYDDRGRDVLDYIYKDVFKAEDALVRHQIISGTHALAICLFGNLRPGDELLSVVGKPYDTLEEVIGIRGDGGGSLKEFGISYNQVELLEDGTVDYDSIAKSICQKTKMVLIQRSRGYDWRSSLTIEEIQKIINIVKNTNNDILVFVDNCYGEFTQDKEPVEVGADLIAGSLIKNPGGGIAPTGGYIAGRRLYVEKSAYRLTAPGLGKNIGCSLGNNRSMLQGLFFAPHVVSESLKGAIFCAGMMERLGFDVSPRSAEQRGDIVQAIKFGDPESLITFCQGIQEGSPVDSYVTPEPSDMPGYENQVIMAAGAFIQGASIELSADGPIKPPYIAYMQGGLVFEHTKLGVMVSIQRMLEKGLIQI
ncbi:MAG: hypothetical protein GX992_09625 [Clostridium sp.]|nr:hypothetical protein [Clostridium sp.]